VCLITNISATELPNFIRKCYVSHELLIFKYWRQNISVSNVALCSQALRRPANRARETVHLLTHETPDFITPALWPANSPDLNPVDCQIWWKLQDHLKSRLIEEWEHFHQVVIYEVVRHWRPMSSSLRSSTRWTFWTQTLGVLASCHSQGARTHTWQSITPVPIWTLMLVSDLTKLAVAVADVDQFCWNLVTCLQFNLTVLLSNFVKIRRCLPELWQRIQCYSFFVDTV